MTREELEMRKIVRESDVIDKTNGSELAKAFNHLWDKYIEQESILDKIRAEIEKEMPMGECEEDYCYAGGLDKALEIIDKYGKE